MSVQTGRRPWTDEELGFLQDHEDWSATRIGEELGRSASAVGARRWHLRRGRYSVVEPWSEDEDDVLIEFNAALTAEQISAKLYGRTPTAVASRRKVLGLRGPTARYVDPRIIGARPLIAKTCTKCGKVLQATWFTWKATEHVWSPECRVCKGDQAKLHKGRPRTTTPEQNHEYERQFRQKMRAITQPRAHRNGQEYTEHDHKVLADPDLTLLEKALKIGRTYAAVAHACVDASYRSHRGLGEPEDLWRIFNPNEEATTEAAAS